MDFSDLNAKGIDRAYREVFAMLARQGDSLTVDRKRSLLASVEIDLDEGDENDEFGTEGWQHAANLD